MNIKIRLFNILILNTLVLFFLIPLCFSQSNSGSVAGTISDLNGNALANVNILIVGTNSGTVSDTNGNFRIDNLKPGKLTLKITCMGYQTEIRNAIIEARQTHQLNVKLVEKVIPMQEIIVTPGNFSIAQSQSVKQQAIEKERITAIPATLDDIYRVLQVMPGVTFSDDYSAHFHVRGGKQNENLILLDGIEIYDPYHLKNIGGAVGVMNMDIIDNISVMTGGFEAKYGDRLSSVVSIENRKGSLERFMGNICAGGTGISLLIESPIPYGSCIVSFRKSFLKEVAEILNPTEYTFSPSFYDVQSKVSLALNSNNQITYNFLYSKDKSYLEKWRKDSELYSDYGNLYQGIVWRSTFSSKFLSEFIVSRGENFWDNRIGDTKEEKLNLIENVFNWSLNFHHYQNHDIGCGMTYKQILYKYELEASKISQDQKEFEDVVESYFGTQKI
ncbi:MAG: carboxypeptidase-like regulatory domain-containing protein, partial [Candidatus Hodarchaeota archaeon]